MRRCLKILWQNLDYLASLTAQRGAYRRGITWARATPQLGARLCAIAGALIITLILLRFARLIFRPVGYCWLALH